MSEKKNVKREIVEWIVTIIAAVLVALFINNFINDPVRGDIIIFKVPDDEKILYIKRVIGMPGETVEIHDNGVYIDGQKMDEPYLTTDTKGDFGPYTVPEGHYFMLGDNRNNSADSRYWQNTFLSKDKIVGKAVLRYWPSVKKLNDDQEENK